MRFEERELKPYAEPVLPGQLREGKVYFSVIFVDEDGLVPSMEPRVFVGSKTDPEGEKLYFQDFYSYQRGIRFESPDADDEASFVTGVGRYIFEYERALDVLMACALKRRKSPTKECRSGAHAWSKRAYRDDLPDINAAIGTTTAISSHDAGGTTTNTKAAFVLGGPKATSP